MPTNRYILARVFGNEDASFVLLDIAQQDIKVALTSRALVVSADAVSDFTGFYGGCEITSPHIPGERVLTDLTEDIWEWLNAQGDAEFAYPSVRLLPSSLDLQSLLDAYHGQSDSADLYWRSGNCRFQCDSKEIRAVIAEKDVADSYVWTCDLSGVLEALEKDFETAGFASSAD